ncbi:MAG: hypothetical protein ABL958_13790 [Bdellovibrionia bacterium]
MRFAFFLTVLVSGPCGLAQEALVKLPVAEKPAEIRRFFCAPELEKLSFDLAEYFSSARSRPDGDSRKRLDTVRVALTDAASRRNPCFPRMAEFYLFESLSRLDFDSRSVTTGLLRIAGDLARARKIVFLTPDERGRRGGIWIETGLSGKPKIAGGYKCEGSAVLLDPFLAPFDLAGVFIHEADHLLRDKISSPGRAELAPIDSVILDETLATVSSAWYQLRQRRASFGKLKSDLTLFSPDGPLRKMWDEIGAGAPILKLSEMLRRTFLRGATGDPAPSMDRWTNETYEIIAKSYFLEESRAAPSKALDSSRLRSSHSPLSTYLEADELDLFKKGMTGPDFFRSLEQRSPECLEFLRDLRSGALRGYLGDASRLKGTEGGKPSGTEGGKPSLTDGAKPCLNGFSEI